MEDKIKDKQALTEVYTVLNELKLFNKIPSKIWKYIVNNKDNNYTFTFDRNRPLYYQITNDNTGFLLSYLTAKYINKDPNIVDDLEKIVDSLK